jgi:hypothetical protein
MMGLTPLLPLHNSAYPSRREGYADINTYGKRTSGGKEVRFDSIF